VTLAMAEQSAEGQEEEQREKQHVAAGDQKQQRGDQESVESESHP
jgi:hypothetical protein